MYSFLINFKSLLSLYIVFIKSIKLYKFFILQLLGITSGIFSTLGIATFIPLLIIILNDDNVLINQASKFIDLELIPNFFIDNLIQVFIFFIFFSYFFKTFISVLFSTLSGGWIEQNAAKARIEIIDVFSKIENRLSGKILDKTSILHLNNQIVIFNSFNWAMLELNLIFYNLLFILILVILASLNFLFPLLILISTLALVLIPIFSMARLGGKIFYETQSTLLKKISYLIEGFDTLITSNSLIKSRKEIFDTNSTVITNGYRISFTASLARYIPEFIVISIICIILLFFDLRTDSLAFFVAYGFVLTRLVAVMNEFTSTLNRSLVSNKAAKEVIHFVEKYKETDQTVKESNDLHNLKKIEKIEFKELTLNFLDQTILDKVNWKVPINSVVLIKGPNGSGKSSFLKCLLGLLPYDGEILINDISFKKINKEYFYDLISYHGQENFLIPGTVFENINLGNDLEHDDVLNFFKNLEININEIFDDGLYHFIDEDSKNISGGERQLICLARSFLKNADIYILDEFTNHLSLKIENSIKKFISNQRDKTFLIITHEENQEHDWKEINFLKGRMK